MAVIWRESTASAREIVTTRLDDIHIPRGIDLAGKSATRGFCLHVAVFLYLILLQYDM